MLTSALTVGVTFVLAIPREEELYVTEFRNVPEGWAAVAGLALVVGLCWTAVWMYRREGRIGHRRACALRRRCCVVPFS